MNQKLLDMASRVKNSFSDLSLADRKRASAVMKLSVGNTNAQNAHHEPITMLYTAVASHLLWALPKNAPTYNPISKFSVFLAHHATCMNCSLQRQNLRPRWIAKMEFRGGLANQKSFWADCWRQFCAYVAIFAISKPEKIAETDTVLQTSNKLGSKQKYKGGGKKARKVTRGGKSYTFPFCAIQHWNCWIRFFRFWKRDYTHINRLLSTKLRTAFHLTKSMRIPNDRNWSHRDTGCIVSFNKSIQTYEHEPEEAHTSLD